MKVEVNYRGIVLEVEGTATPAQGDGWNEPYVEAEFEATLITLKGVNICEMLSEEQWTDIESLAIKECK